MATMKRATPAKVELPKSDPTLPSTKYWQMRAFQLVRANDTSNVTAGGVVAEGVEWTDGTVTVNWVHGEMSNHANMKQLATAHCAIHATEVIWM